MREPAGPRDGRAECEFHCPLISVPAMLEWVPPRGRHLVGSAPWTDSPGREGSEVPCPTLAWACSAIQDRHHPMEDHAPTQAWNMAPPKPFELDAGPEGRSDLQARHQHDGRDDHAHACVRKRGTCMAPGKHSVRTLRPSRRKAHTCIPIPAPWSIGRASFGKPRPLKRTARCCASACWRGDQHRRHMRDRSFDPVCLRPLASLPGVTLINLQHGEPALDAGPRRHPTMRLFRQESAGDWAGVFGRMAEAVGSALRTNSPGREGTRVPCPTLALRLRGHVRAFRTGITRWRTMPTRA